MSGNKRFSADGVAANVTAEESPVNRTAERAESAREVWMYPGLGCRYVGMGSDFLGRVPEADAVVAEASEWLGYDVRSACLEGSGRKVVSPRQESQLIFVISCASTAAARARDWRPDVVIGHSLGCWAAACSAGLYPLLTGLTLLTRVEELLEELIDPDEPQGMGVIIGLEAAELDSLLREEGDVWVANWNSPRQQVISGRLEGVERVLEQARQRGVKQARRLPTSRAMHTPLLTPVAAELERELKRMELREPTIPLIGTQSGESRDPGSGPVPDVTSGSELTSSSELARFLSRALVWPVFWADAITRLQRTPGATFVDVGPGGVLAGMLPHIDPRVVVETISGRLERQAVE